MPCGRSWLVAIINSLEAVESGDRAGTGTGGGAPGFLCIISVLCAPNERTNIFRGMDGPRTDADFATLKQKERRFQQQRGSEGKKEKDDGALRAAE